jgi:hypothetical protein
LVPKKRLTLTLKLNSNANTVPLFSYFLRMPDSLVSSAHFRPEVMRRIRQTREEEAKKVRKIVEAEGAEDRKLLSDKAKKEQRDRKLKGMSADEQKRFLEREREQASRRCVPRSLHSIEDGYGLTASSVLSFRGVKHYRSCIFFDRKNTM